MGKSLINIVKCVQNSQKYLSLNAFKKSLFRTFIVIKYINYAIVKGEVNNGA